MANGRMLNVSIAKDLRLNNMSIEAEYIYLKAIPHLDRDGIINGDPVVLWADVCPRRTDLMPKMASLVKEIVDSGLVIAYHCDTTGETALFFTGFKENNKAMRYDREKPSRFNPPPGHIRTETGIELEPKEDESGGTTPPSAPTEPKVPPTDSELTGIGETQESGTTPGQLPDNDGIYPRQDQVKDQVKDQDQTTSGPQAVVVDEASVFQLWQDNMPGSLTPVIVDELNDYIETYGVLEVDTAIRKAVSANKRSSRYIAGILRNRAAGTEPPQKQDTKPVFAGVSGELGFDMKALAGGVL